MFSHPHAYTNAREGGDALPYKLPTTLEKPPGIVTGRLTLFYCPTRSLALSAGTARIEDVGPVPVGAAFGCGLAEVVQGAYGVGAEALEEDCVHALAAA